MNFDNLIVIWNEEHSHPSGTLDLDDESLRRMVLQRAHAFRKTIFWRDVREVGVAAVLAILFLVDGVQSAGEDSGRGPYSLETLSYFLLALGVAFVGAFILVTRHRQKKREATNPEDSIRGNLRSLIANVDYQLRLLRNVAWWYLFPLVPGLILLLAARAQSAPLLSFFAGLIIFLVFAFVYWLNLETARKHLLPQKQELQSLLTRLEKNGDAETNGHE